MTQGETARIHRWLSRLQSGDQGALNELIIHFERRLRALTRRMIKDYPLVHMCEQTDDVYQNAVLRLGRALKAVTPLSTRELLRLSATQVRRELLNLARFYRARPDLLQRAAPPHTATSMSMAIDSNLPDELPERHVEDDVHLLDQWTRFHEAAASLPEPRREVFDLIWYHGMAVKDVSEIQQVDPRTVRNRWNSARMTIYDALGGSLPGM